MDRQKQKEKGIIRFFSCEKRTHTHTLSSIVLLFFRMAVKRNISNLEIKQELKLLFIHQILVFVVVLIKIVCKEQIPRINFNHLCEKINSFCKFIITNS